MSDERVRPWRLRTPRQAAASRVNGAKGRGPKSDDGKLISSQNARQHGLRSLRVDPEPLRRFCAALLAGADPDQRDLLLDVAAACVRLERAAALVAERLMKLDSVLPSVKLGEDVAPLQPAATARPMPGKADIAVVIETDAEDSTDVDVDILGELQKIIRYERRFRGQRDRSLKQYLKARAR